MIRTIHLLIDKIPLELALLEDISNFRLKFLDDLAHTRHGGCSLLTGIFVFIYIVYINNVLLNN